jgi:hypothetical protein
MSFPPTYMKLITSMLSIRRSRDIIMADQTQRRGRLCGVRRRTPNRTDGRHRGCRQQGDGYSDVLRNKVRGFSIDMIITEPGAIKTEWGIIAAYEAERFSGRGAYADLVVNLNKLQNGDRKRSLPWIISDLIVKSLRARRPATRFHGRGVAGSLLLMLRYMSDRAFDRSCRPFAEAQHRYRARHALALE